MFRYALRSALLLTLLEVVVSSGQATGRLGELASGISNATKYLLSSAYPLIPDRRPAAGTGTAPAAPSTPNGGSGSGDDPPLEAPPPISTTPTSTGVISV